MIASVFFLRGQRAVHSMGPEPGSSLSKGRTAKDTPVAVRSPSRAAGAAARDLRSC